VGPGALECILHKLPRQQSPAVLVGLEAPDDAGVYQLDAERALIQTVDFFPPMVDDPYTFGQVAAANALSDVYAMGGEVLTAMNIVCFPTRTLSLDVLGAILAGGADTVINDGGVILGGHTIEDEEPKYGLAVTGLVDPRKIISNGGARPGDVLVLTKPLGTGVIVTAIKGGLLSEAEAGETIQSMIRTNRTAGRLMQAAGASASTDITGFGLLGHSLEMSAGCGYMFEFELDRIPWLARAPEMAEMGMVPAGAYSNEHYFGPQVIEQRKTARTTRDLLFDPQTSGGLLVALPESRAADFLTALEQAGERGWLVGRVQDEPGAGIYLR